MAESSGNLRGLYVLNTDGGMEPGRTPRRAGEPLRDAAIGGVLRTPRLAVLAEISEAIGPVTHNVAEYRALIRGLETALDHGVQRLRAYMDSELVVDQVNGLSVVKEPRLRELHGVVDELRGRFASVRFAWVPRECNARADELARAAFSDSD
jgi:probable phosphoglycerate mutase